MGVGLAVTAGPVTGVRHQLRRHPHDALTGAEQVAFESVGQVLAGLDSP
jgi:hypothetical protein